MTTKLPKCIYARGYGSNQTFYVSVSVDGLRINLGTFSKLAEAEASLRTFRLKELLAVKPAVAGTEASLSGSLSTLTEATIEASLTTVLTEIYEPQLLATWNELLACQDPSSLDGAYSTVVSNENNELITIPAIVVAAYLADMWKSMEDSRNSSTDNTRIKQ